MSTTARSQRACVYCHRDIPKRAGWSVQYYATRQYCDRQCMQDAQPNIETDYKVTEAGCWEWQGRLDANGYGKAYDVTRPLGKRVDWAHRVSYRRHRGEIPERCELDHTCENTICINPDHLDPVTRSEHARRTMQRLGKDVTHQRAAQLRRFGYTYAEISDLLGYADRTSAASAVDAAIAKGLIDPDSVPRIHFLTEQEREDIRVLYSLAVPQTEIAAWYDVDSSHVSRICQGKTSGHDAEVAS